MSDCDTCTRIARTLAYEEPAQKSFERINTQNPKPKSRMPLTQPQTRVLAAQGGAFIGKGAQLIYREIDRSMNRSGKPLLERVATWANPLTGLAAGVFAAMYGDRYGMETFEMFNGIAAQETPTFIDSVEEQYGLYPYTNAPLGRSGRTRYRELPPRSAPRVYSETTTPVDTAGVTPELQVSVQNY